MRPTTEALLIEVTEILGLALAVVAAGAAGLAMFGVGLTVMPTVMIWASVACAVAFIVCLAIADHHI